ncbi:transglycosylase SLT domain-containing protein [Inhella proteolytica]|uniref:Transglycosylase SLT domain-containing protein n=1 Tax=Inhella proteolytica TaxID=2795029 RepID=A0A931IZE8_9BURK|nr:transglycosylase SLT domain-containing protein [Inhella proteolytica]MBH9576624.1 transglycosylase SLT domain-containing protein [Inhella proteolytica]
MQPVLRHALTLSTLAVLALLSGCATAPDGSASGSLRAQPPEAAETAAVPPAPAAAPELPKLNPALIDHATAKAQDDLNPDQPAVDFQAPEAQKDLWMRIRAAMQLEELTGPRVQKWEEFYAKRPEYVGRMTERGGRYLFHIVQEVEKRGLPMELALLPFIESAFNPESQSHAKAVGMWQFMSATGKDFSLKQNLFRDDRRNVLASTRAALDYLAQLGKRYDGDWQLALAAYNWGLGNVDRAIKRLDREGKERSYANLRMPNETADYLPKLQAVKNLVLRPQDFGVQLPDLANHPYFLTVQVEGDIDVELAARLAGLSVERFRQFNPQMNKPIILAAATPQLLLPYDNAAQFVQALEAHQGQKASWTALQLPKTMKPAEAAKWAGMSEAELREINRIPPRMNIKAGSTLLVPRTAKRDHDVSEHLAETAALALAPDAPARRAIKVTVRKGDTLASVARRNGVTVAQLAEWNQLSLTARVKPGAKLTSYVPNRPAAKLAGGKKSGAKKVAAKSGKTVKAAVKASTRRAKTS